MTLASLLVFTGVGEELELIEKQIPEIGHAEVLVKNLYTTLCGSDLHTFCGVRHEKTPTVLGHEIVGEVVEIGSGHTGRDYAGNPLRVGDVVTWCIFSSDPQSAEALKGMPQKASGLFKYGHAQLTDQDAFHGGLAEYCILKENTAILRIPGDVPLAVAATINCAIATVAGALRLAGDIRGKRVLITGLGLLGIVCTAMCKDAGAAMILTADINSQRLGQSLAFGAGDTYLLGHSEVNAVTDQLQPSPEDMDVVFDMSGAPDAMEMGINSLRVGGIAIWVGAVFTARKVACDAEQIVRKLITIKGLHNYNYEDFVAAVEFIGRCHKDFPFDKIIGKEFTLSQAQAAFEYALAHKPLRVGIRL
ncbi:alcohol dehydrogenase catalytic domain-containing protein [Dyadobacter sp. LHD-138]|uniref:alcohol dehydrogenase catalytic domain-containing protein n=1 Tax=Dyadobacter sp. LHD-138 TaxID=3071413 RepID=UPI0027DF3826|nr:alcohol dehydrogenase catalytic domain-containing protein [Dyadobacter sp. LHD-138]MDQ6480122.1 alcohol dehydrogenase catalytic domain-containing protein [Dyadobacter sp. LHD-138]